MTAGYKPQNGPSTPPKKFDYSLFVAREVRSKPYKDSFAEAEEKLKGVKLENGLTTVRLPSYNKK